MANIFPLVPDWANGILEKLEWQTDVLQSPVGAEQRRGLRLAPRRTLETTILADGRERAHLDLLTYDLGASEWLIPMWHDVQIVAIELPVGSQAIPTDTRYREFVPGGQALLRSNTAFSYEAVTVLQVLPDLLITTPTAQPWPAGTRLYPLRLARLTEMPKHSRLTDRLVSAQMQWQITEACDWSGDWPYGTYRGWPVVGVRPQETDDMSATYEWLQQTLDNNTGKPYVLPTAKQGFQALSHSWLLAGRAERDALRRVFYHMQGKLQPVWMPTWYSDFDMAGRFCGCGCGSDSYIDVEWTGYTQHGRRRINKRDLRIQLVDGTVISVRVTGSAELDTDRDIERLTIRPQLSRRLDPREVLSVNFMALSRLDQDSIEIQHITDVDGVATCSVVFRAVLDELTDNRFFLDGLGYDLGNNLGGGHRHLPNLVPWQGLGWQVGESLGGVAKPGLEAVL